MENRELGRTERRQSDVFMRNKVTGNDGEIGNLDGVFLKFENIPVRRVVNSGGRNEEMIGAEGAVPIWVVVSEFSNDARQRARGGVWGERDEEEVGLGGISGEKWAAEEGVVEERRRGVGEIEGLRRGVNENLEIRKHVLVILEKCGGGEVRGRRGGGEKWEEDEEDGE